MDMTEKELAKQKFAKALGQVITRERKKAGFKTPEDLAKEVGCDPSEIAAYEAGVRVPNSFRLMQIMKTLGLEEIEVI